MRIAVVLRDVPDDWGGEATLSDSLMRALRDLEPGSRHEFTYYSTGGSADPSVLNIPEPEPYHPGLLTILRKARGYPPPPEPTWLQSSLDERGIDLVWFAASHAEVVEQPMIFTVLDIEHRRQPWFPELSRDREWKARQEFFSTHIPRATRIIVPNEEGVAQVSRWYGVDRDRLLPLHHPTTGFALEAAGRPPLPRDALDARGIGTRYLFYPARLWPHKDHVTLLRALAELNAEGDPLELVLVGADYRRQRAHLESVAAELGVLDQVHFLGWIETEELVALYQHAFALAYPSRFGTENLPPLEAMALGCPAVVADVPGAREQFGDAAFRFEPGDAGAIADAIRQLEDEGVRSGMVDAGRALATERTAERYVEGVFEFLDEFAETRRLWA